MLCSFVCYCEMFGVCVCVCVDFVIVIFSLPEMMNRVEYIKSVGLFEFLVLLEA